MSVSGSYYLRTLWEAFHDQSDCAQHDESKITALRKHSEVASCTLLYMQDDRLHGLGAKSSVALRQLVRRSEACFSLTTP